MKILIIKKTIIYRSIVSWICNRNISVSASLAYYSLFSLAPVLVLSISIAGIIFGVEAAQGHLMHRFEGLLGKEGASLLQNMVRLSYFSENNILALSVSVIGILIGATAVFSEISFAFERIFKEKRRYHWAWIGFVIERLYGLILVVGIGLVTITSLIASTFIATLSRLVIFFNNNNDIFINFINILSSFFATFLIFYLMIAIMCPVSLPKKIVFLGSLNTAFFFELGKYIISLYIGYRSTTSIFGATGTIAALLVWLNYASMIILFGIELTNTMYMDYKSKKQKYKSKNNQ